MVAYKKVDQGLLPSEPSSQNLTVRRERDHSLSLKMVLASTTLHFNFLSVPAIVRKKNKLDL